MKPDDALASDVIVAGQPPTSRPPRVTEFEDLDKKALDVLVDSLKYVATTSGIVIAMYSQSVRENLKIPIIESRPTAQILLFAPLLLWFGAIIGTVIGIFPREHHAITDAEKESVIRDLRRKKIFWVRLVLVPFLLGFAVFIYVIGAQIWKIYPFR